MMSDPHPATAAFPVAFCGTCDKSVLTWVRLDEAGTEHRMCVHCDGPADASLSWIGASDLDALGYWIGTPPARGGCGSGGGCSSCKIGKQ